MKRFIAVVSMLIAVCSIAVAEELCLVTIKANGTESTYSIPAVKNVTVENATFTVNLKDGSADKEGKVIKFGQMSTSTQETPADAIEANVYATGKTIYVKASEVCDIYFFNLAGQRLGDCVKASECECTISLAGTYIVLVGGQQYKIQLQ